MKCHANITQCQLNIPKLSRRQSASRQFNMENVSNYELMKWSNSYRHLSRNQLLFNFTHLILKIILITPTICTLKMSLYYIIRKQWAWEKLSLGVIHSLIERLTTTPHDDIASFPVCWEPLPKFSVRNNIFTIYPNKRKTASICNEGLRDIKKCLGLCVGPSAAASHRGKSVKITTAMYQFTSC